MPTRREVIFDERDEHHGRSSWWQRHCTAAEFGARIRAMPTTELETLASEIKGSIAILQAQLDTRKPADDPDWHQKAYMARGFIVEKKHLLNVELKKRNVGVGAARRAERVELASRARALLRGGDIAGALDIVLDILDATHKRDSE